MVQALTPEDARSLDRLNQGLAQQIHPLPTSDPFGETGEEENRLDLRKYWAMLLRRKWIILTAAALGLLVSLIETYNTTPIYRSTLLLQIEPPSTHFIEAQERVSLEPTWNWTYYQTQYALLKSRSLARRVIDRLGLEAVRPTPPQEKPSFFRDLKRSLQAWFGGTSPEETQPRAKSHKLDLEDLLMSRLHVVPMENSQLVELHYDSPNPKEAATIVNAVAETYINTTLERRYKARTYAKRFLEERLQKVRANLEDSEQRLIAYARQREIVDLEDKLSSVMQRLNAMSAALSEAERARIQAEANYASALKGTGDATLKELESPVIQTLKEKKAELELSYQEQLRIYKPGYPKMQQLHRQIVEVGNQIQEEVAAIRQAIQVEYETKIREQEALRAKVDALKKEVLNLQSQTTDYRTLKRDVDTNRALYDSLLQRLKDVSVVAGISTNNISIVDRAQVPGAPYTPNLRKNLTKGLAMGLAVGLLLAFFFEYIDDRVKSNEEVENRVRAPVLGLLPLVREKDRENTPEVGLLSAQDPKSPFAEAMRSLRTALSFSTAEGAPKILHVTSAGPGEGKSTAATNIAITFAQAGKKVLLIDSDLRAPSLHRLFDLPNHLGLSNYLAGNVRPAEIAQPTQIRGLFSITSGPLAPNPVELLTSAKMLDLLHLSAERFDYVILDGPPVIGLADALVLANLAHGTLFVVDISKARYGAIEGAVKRLRAANAPIVGAIIERFEHRTHGYGYDYNYQYDYGSREEAEPLLPEKA